MTLAIGGRNGNGNPLAFFAFPAVHNLGHAPRTVSGVYEVAASAIWLGTVEAPDKKAGIEKNANYSATRSFCSNAAAQSQRSLLG
jgi:hypothetical protein